VVEGGPSLADTNDVEAFGGFSMKLVMANFMKVFLNHVRYGAEAKDVCVQDPPKSGVDLEGA